MGACAITVGAGFLLVASGVLADEHSGMRAAQQELKVARTHLQESARTYGGHRKAAIDHINAALDEVRMGLAAVGAAGPGARHPRHEPQRTEDD